MPEVFFTTSGDDGPSPANAEEIVASMRSRGEDYWNDPDGSGFAELSFCAEGRKEGPTSQLIFTKSDGHGFHFWFSYPVRVINSPYYREPDSYYSCSDPDLKEWVAVGDSHEGRRPLFTGLFVPIDTAVEVVREFIRTGAMTDRARWVTGEVIREAERRHGLA